MPGKKAYFRTTANVFLAAILSFSLWACVQPKPASTTEMAASSERQSPSTKAMSKEEKEIIMAEAQSILQNTDCSKCHDRQPADIMNNGKKHKTEIGCLDCHVEHLPLGKKTIPQCSMCHNPSDIKHFGLGERKVCVGCHRNPHTPLDVTVDDVPQTSVGCKTCHSDKGEEFAKFPSKHAQKNCTHCHPTKHKQIHKCLTCHEPHAEFMVYENCLQCHKPHSPLNIQYADDTPSKFCGACHADLFNMLTNSQAKHGKLNCAYCHKKQHPTVPNCRDCHGNPHDSTILSPFNSDCLKCHRNPHDLVF